MENLPVIIAEVSVAPSGELFRNTFFFCACFRRFTVGSIKTRQITLWAVGLITTNHDMRPIRFNTECYALKSNHYQEVHRVTIFLRHILVCLQSHGLRAIKATALIVQERIWWRFAIGKSLPKQVPSLTVGHLIALLTPTTIASMVISIDVLHKLDI